LEDEMAQASLPVHTRATKGKADPNVAKNLLVKALEKRRK
jgi:hypothetical protein